MSWQTIARRLGSRWCCAWQVGVTLVLLGLVLSAGLTLRLGWADYLRATATELFADAAAALVLALAAVTVLRSRGRRPQPVLVVFATWIAVAAVRGVVFALLAPDVIGSVLTFNVAIPVWAMVVIYVYATIDDGRRGARDVAAANSALLAAQERTTELLSEERGRLADVVQARISAEVASLRETVSSLALAGAAADVNALADRVSEYSTKVVRTASHRLREPDAALLGPDLQPGTAQVPWPSIGDVYARAQQPIVLPVALITMRGLIGSLLRWDPSTLLAQALIFTAVLAIAWLGRALIERLVRRPSVAEVLLSTALVVGIGLLAVWAFAIARTSAPDNPALIPLPAIGVFIVGVFLIGRLVAGVNLRWKQVTAELTEVNAELSDANEQLTRELAQAREQVADVLHGPVQGRLAAASMALRLYADAHASGRPADLDATLATTTTLLDRAIDDLGRLGQPSPPTWSGLAEGLDALAQTWAGLVTVTWQAEHTDQLATGVTSLIVDLCGELVTNASRHAGARQIDIHIRARPDGSIEVDAVNDGRPAPADPVAGSGLGLLTRHQGHWSITSAGTGRTRVHVELLPASA